jgi:hypothetical protein
MHVSSYLRLTAAVAILAVTTSSAKCTREGLLIAADSYLAAQVKGDPGTLGLSSTGFTYI